MKRIQIALAFALMLGGVAIAADVADTGYKESAVSGGVKLMRQTGTYSAITGGGAATSKSFSIGAPAAILKGVLVTSTDCVDCDIFIVTVAGTGGTANVFEEANGSSKTVNGVAYQTWIAQVPDVPALVSDTATEYLVYVRIVNNDAGARTVIVSLVWGTE